MAKRRRRKPNIAADVLEQARQGAAAEGDAPEASAAEPQPVNAPPRRRRTLQAAQLERRKDAGKLDGEYVAELLANPTKQVSEEDLRADYGFVIKDLRNMGILGGGALHRPGARFVALAMMRTRQGSPTRILPHPRPPVSTRRGPLPRINGEGVNFPPMIRGDRGG